MWPEHFTCCHKCAAGSTRLYFSSHWDGPSSHVLAAQSNRSAGRYEKDSPSASYAHVNISSCNVCDIVVLIMSVGVCSGIL